MGKLKTLAAGSSLMKVEILYEGKRIKFNLYEELNIQTDRINTEIKDQPKIYGFISMLLKATRKEARRLELQKETALSKAIFELTSSKGSRYFKQKGTYCPANMAKEIGKSDPMYVMASKKHARMKGQEEDLESIVKSFEMRAQLIQTLSANKRRIN